MHWIYALAVLSFLGVLIPVAWHLVTEKQRDEKAVERARQERYKRGEW